MADAEFGYVPEQTEAEREIFERELDSFVPDRALDAHAHMWPGTAPDAENDPKPWLREHMTLARWQELMTDQMPGRAIGGLMLAVPQGIHGLAPSTEASIRRHAEHIAAESAANPLCQPTMFVSPWMDPDYVKQEARRLDVKGLKVIPTPRARRSRRGTPRSRIFCRSGRCGLPTSWASASRCHMVKDRSVSDPSNQHWIRTYCERYPDMKLILAHAARSFNPVWAMEGIHTLKGVA